MPLVWQKKRTWAYVLLGQSWVTDILVWSLCGYRCFKLQLVKLTKREKLLPQICWRGRGGRMRGAYLSSAVCGYSIDSMWLRCVCWTLQHSTAVPGKAILFLTCTQVSFSEEWFSVVRACVSHASWHTPVLMVCMPYVARGRLQGHRATRSLGVHCGERKQA